MESEKTGKAKLARRKVDYRLLAENARDLVCLHDLEGKYLYVSTSSAAMLGYAPDELVGTSPYDLIHPQDAERVRDETHARLLKGETGIVVEYRMRDKPGDYHWFETMWQTVAGANGKILRLQTVSRDISKRREDERTRERAQNDLAQMFVGEQEARRIADFARVELEHASRAKDEFLQMVSHEFRTPLTTIKTLVRVLQHDGKSKAVREKHLETIAAECDRQIDLILNLLDVSRLEEGDADLKNEPVDINRVLDSCDKIERPAAEAREQTLSVERDKSLPKVAGDEKAIRRALCTIVENSVKYTTEGGTITVAARHIAHHGVGDAAETDKKIAAELFGDLPKQMDFSGDKPLTGEEIAVAVCDTGRGILPADIPKLFQKFYRGAKPLADASTDGTPDDAAGKAETPGVGLGLYLAKRLITALGGRITVNSEVGRGSCFTIYLPVWNEKSGAPDADDEYDFDEGAAR
jgi:PAS domain S-box-containing protein